MLEHGLTRYLKRVVTIALGDVKQGLCRPYGRLKQSLALWIFTDKTQDRLIVRGNLVNKSGIMFTHDCQKFT